MKKLIPLLILLLVLQACSTAAPPVKAEGIHVVTTSFPLYDIAREIGGKGINVELLLPPGAEVHTFEPTPADLKKITQSDLFLYVGGHSDAWINTMLDSTELPADKTLKLMDKVDTLAEEQSESMVEEEHDHDHGHAHDHSHDHDHDHDHDHETAAEETKEHDHSHDHDHDHETAAEETKEHDHDHDHDHDHETAAEETKEHDHDHDHDHDHETAAEETKEHDHDHDHDHDHGHGEEYDEHVWLSMDNAEKIAKALSEKFQEMDKVNAPLFKEREEKFLEKLAALKKDYKDMVAGAKRKEIIVGDRFPFLYLVKNLGLSYDAAYPGCSANVEENAQTIKALIDKVKDQKIPVVFYIEMSQGRIADRIVEATGARKVMLHSIQNVSKEEMDAGEGYFSLMKKNLEALKEALY